MDRGLDMGHFRFAVSCLLIYLILFRFYFIFSSDSYGETESISKIK